MRLLLQLCFPIVIALIFSLPLNATTYTSTGTGGNWFTTGTWDNGVPDNSGTANVVIANGTTVTIDLSTPIVINNLTIGQGTSGTLQFGKVNGVVMTVNGNVLVMAGATFKVQTNTTNPPAGGLLHTLDLKGDFSHNGSNLTFRAGSAGTSLSVCNMTLSGSSDSHLSITGTYTPIGNGINAVNINKSGGANVILLTDFIQVGGSSTNAPTLNCFLTFTNGIIETGNYKWVNLSTTEATLTGYSSSSYVKGTLGRAMSSSGASNKYFPVGDANGYRLFKLYSTSSGSATGHYAYVSCIPGDANTGSSTLVGIDKVSKVRYYQVGYNSSLAGAASMSFERFCPSYGSDDGVIAGSTLLKVAYSLDNRATWTKISATYTAVATDPPAMIIPDRLDPAQTLNSGSSMFIALGDSLSGDNPLPIELSSFSSNVKGRTVILNWLTKTEKNSDKFIVDRTTVGDILNWVTVSSVKASVLSNSPKQYSFTDNNLQTGKYQYRLKMIDNDGSFQFSKIVEAEVGLPKTFDLSQNYPNPFNPTTKIDYQIPVDAKVIMDVYNIAGQQVLELVNQDQSAGYYTIDFGKSKLTSGVYIYRLVASDKATGNNFSSIRKMLLLK